jgi:hypothetical protein
MKVLKCIERECERFKSFMFHFWYFYLNSEMNNNNNEERNNHKSTMTSNIVFECVMKYLKFITDLPWSAHFSQFITIIKVIIVIIVVDVKNKVYLACQKSKSLNDRFVQWTNLICQQLIILNNCDCLQNKWDIARCVNINRLFFSSRVMQNLSFSSQLFRIVRKIYSKSLKNKSKYKYLFLQFLFRVTISLIDFLFVQSL